MSQNDQPGGLFEVIGAAAAMVACCAGLPLLVGGGIALGAVGVAAGSVVIVVAGAALAVWAWRRRRSAGRECDRSDAATNRTGRGRT